MPRLNSDDIAALYEAHSRAILRHLMRRTFDAQVSIDLLSETFAVAYARRGKFRGAHGSDSARAWLYGIAGHLLSDYFRSGEIERRAMSKLGVDRTIVADHEIERIEELAEIAGLRAAVASALGDLTEENRAALHLRIVEELPYPEVAAQLDVSEQVARARVSRGLRGLRERLEGLELEGVSESV